MNIFVVSKFQSSAELLSIFLRMLGHETDYSESGEAARELKRNRFDILLLGCELSSSESSGLAKLFRRRNPCGRVIALVAEKGARPCFCADGMVELSNGAPALLSTIQATYQEARSAGTSAGS